MERSLDIIYLTKRPETDANAERDRPVFLIEVTEEMKEAGEYQLKHAHFGCNLRELAADIFYAMQAEAYAT